MSHFSPVPEACKPNPDFIQFKVQLNWPVTQIPEQITGVIIEGVSSLLKSVIHLIGASGSPSECGCVRSVKKVK
jgi:hypothetical protein